MLLKEKIVFMFLKKYEYLFFGIILLFSVFPFLYLFQCNVPLNDDFCVAVQTRQLGFWSHLIDYYMNWGGRVVAMIHLSFNDFLISHLSLFRIVGLILFLVHFFSVFYLIKTLFNGMKPKIIFSFFVFFMVIELLYIRSVQQGFYWLTGVFAYLIPISYLFLTVSCYLKYSGTNKKTYLILTFMFGILASGSHELVALLSLSIFVLFKICTFTIYNYRDKIKKSDIALFLTLLTIFLIIVFAPGNFKREETVTLNKSNTIIDAIFKSTNLLIYQINKWLQNGVILSVSLLFISAIVQNKHFKKVNFKTLAIMLSGFTIILLFTLFIPILFTDTAAARVLNVTFLFFILFYFISLFILISFLSLKIKIKPLNLIYKIIISIFIIFQLKDGNIRIAYNDILSGNANKFSLEWETRFSQSINENNSSLVFKPLTICPQSICGEDLPDDTNDWRNTCYSNYFNLEKVKVED